MTPMTLKQLYKSNFGSRVGFSSTVEGLRELILQSPEYGAPSCCTTSAAAWFATGMYFFKRGIAWLRIMEDCRKPEA